MLYCSVRIYLRDFLCQEHLDHTSRRKTGLPGIQSRASHARVFRSRDASERRRGPEGTRSPPPPSARSIPRAAAHPKRDIRGTPDWASYKRGMRSPRTPRARASRLDRALTSPPRSNTQAIQAAKGYVHFRGSSLVRPPRPRFTGGSGTKTPRARSAPTARRTRAPLVAAPAKTFLPAFRKTHKRSRLTAAPLSPARRIP